MTDHLTRSGWVPVVNGGTIPTLHPTKDIALKDAKRIADMLGITVFSAEPFSCSLTMEQYRDMLRPYVNEEDMP